VEVLGQPRALADDGRRDFDLPVVDLTPREFAVLEQRGWDERQLGWACRGLPPVPGY
jgi:hypothetical protein